ncbi:MAG TPA: hypothetical protein VEA37_12985 [Flavobacterium sp.]|nr:hypothetical protein [Flavobacterium sp.]
MCETKTKLTSDVSLPERVRMAATIYLKARQTFTYCLHLFQSDQHNQSEHLNVLQYDYFSLTIIEFAKLFCNSSNQKSNLLLLLDNVISSFPDTENESKDLFVFMGFREDFNKYLEAIDKIRTLRDQLYAHSDYTYKPITLDSDFITKLESLQKLAGRIIPKLYNKILGASPIYFPGFNLSDFRIA